MNNSKKTETEKENTARNMQEPTTRSNVKTSAKKETVIYIGPTIPGVVVKNTVFNNGLPELLKEKITEIPAARSLIVPIGKLSEAKAAIQQSNTAENVYYKKLQNSIEA